jgi:uncharacterized protein (TIGR00369 family)
MSTNPDSPDTRSPYADALGVRRIREDDREVLTMPFGDHLIGRPGFLHGGAITGLVENAAWFMLRDTLDREGSAAFKPITITVDFLRGGKTVDTYAAAKIIRMGRRLAVVEAWGWQEDEASPIVRADLKFLIVR